MQWVISLRWWLNLSVANMKTLPFDLQKPFFKVLLEQGLLSEFETWVYHTPSLEAYLSADAYLALISLDFNDKKSLLNLEKLITPHLDFIQYYQDKLSATLLALTDTPDDKQRLAQIYDWYCQGYAFLEKLALEFGLTADLSLWEADYQAFQFSQSDLQKIQTTAKALYDKLKSGQIVLLASPSYDCNETHYQDNHPVI